MKNDVKLLFSLVKRGLKVYLSDRMGVFLSLLAPIIILFLYVMFLGEIQADTVRGYLEGLDVSGKLIRSFVDSWMLAGVMAVSCITVSYCAQTVMVGDREKGVMADMLTSPVKRGLLSASYLVANIIITLTIVTIVLVIAFIYLAIAGWSMSVGDVFKVIGITLLSVISASLFSTSVAMFIRTQSAHGGAGGILSAAIGFFIGAYMPVSIFPKGIQYIVLFIPGTYSAGLFRNAFMQGALKNIVQNVPASAAAQVCEQMKSGYSMTMDAFGSSIGEDRMWVGFVVATAILLAIYIIIEIVKSKRGTLFFSLDSRLKRQGGKVR